MREDAINIFFKEIKYQPDISPTLVSFYSAILFCWNENDQCNPFNITRKKVMMLSRIQGIATYHKCVRQLVSMGFIEYQPTYNKFIGSCVTLKKV